MAREAPGSGARRRYARWSSRRGRGVHHTRPGLKGPAGAADRASVNAPIYLVLVLTLLPLLRDRVRTAVRTPAVRTPRPRLDAALASSRVSRTG